MHLVPQPELTPLTARNVDGVPYRRPSEVESEIAELVQYDRRELLDRINSDSCGPEALVYFYRIYISDAEMNEAIFGQIAKRVRRLIRRHAMEFKDPEDFMQDVFVQVITKISDMATSSGDYAQVRFGDFVASESGNVRKRMFNRRRNESITDSIDDIDDDRHAAAELPALDSSVEDRLIAREEIARLPEKLRVVCSLYYVEGWKIASKDPNEMTLSKLFGKSDRQIRNWLREAARLLADNRGGSK